MSHRALRLLAVLVLPLAVLAGCGDDDDGGDVAAYCELGRELDAQDAFPSEEQLEELRDVAPAEIEDEVGLVVDRLQEDGEAAFEDPDFNGAIEEMEAYEADACGREDLDPAGDDVDDSDTGGDVDDSDTDDDVDDDTTTTEAATTTTSEGTTTTTVEETTTTAGG